MTSILRGSFRSSQSWSFCVRAGANQLEEELGWLEKASRNKVE